MEKPPIRFWTDAYGREWASIWTAESWDALMQAEWEAEIQAQCAEAKRRAEAEAQRRQRRED
jgi:hypothetical protein